MPRPDQPATNDTQDWDSHYNLETEPAIQQELAAAHFTLLRTWFFQYDLADQHAITDAEQLARVRAVHEAGMTCLGELPTANSMAYDEHLVSLLKGQCELYEFMNEPDDEHVSISTYVTDWYTEIPKLRTLDPNARFGGPAAAGPSYSQCIHNPDGTQECYMQQVLAGMARSGVLPDFVTFHWYPCWQMDANTCLAQTSTFGDQVRLVRGWVNQYFGAAGKNIPVGVTEWNADPSAPMPSYAQGATWMTTFTTQAEESMVSAGVSFANQFDLASYAGYGSDDMVDIYHNGAPKAQWNALVSLIRQVYPGAMPPAPTPAPTSPLTPTRTHTATPMPPSTGGTIGPVDIRWILGGSVGLVLVGLLLRMFAARRMRALE
jgi:hypothetical protein